MANRVLPNREEPAKATNKHGWITSDHNGADHYHDETGIAVYFDSKDIANVAFDEIDHREIPGDRV